MTKKKRRRKKKGHFQQVMFARMSVAPEAQRGGLLRARLSLLVFHITDLSPSPLFPQIWQWGDSARMYAQQRGCEEIQHPFGGWCRQTHMPVEML